MQEIVIILKLGVHLIPNLITPKPNNQSRDYNSVATATGHKLQTLEI